MFATSQYRLELAADPFTTVVLTREKAVQSPTEIMHLVSDHRTAIIFTLHHIFIVILVRPS